MRNEFMTAATSLTDRGEAGLNPMEGVAPYTGRIGDGNF
jgi:hypothetical protein